MGYTPDQQTPILSPGGVVHVSTSQGGFGGGSGSGGTGSAGGTGEGTKKEEEKPKEYTTLAEQVAANLGALGYTKSPLAEETAASPVIVQAAPAKNSMLVIIGLLVLAAVVLWYMKKHGEL